jgi:hypothetical protein
MHVLDAWPWAEHNSQRSDASCVRLDWYRWRTVAVLGPDVTLSSPEQLPGLLLGGALTGKEGGALCTLERTCHWPRGPPGVRPGTSRVERDSGPCTLSRDYGNLWHVHVICQVQVYIFAHITPFELRLSLF